ncbi:MAG TPA: DUF362 domain-containing protein [Candidatus Wallbacteria bacterium]|nr:MAG: hypothetical protein BWY32_03828 [bacterium ADurb.Bin243]HOD38933.1 DUF362 domain-containing protein [Candidatus Wallbacteria bacterium]HPG58147.1 DUF362 domain-containing protein [Candidatus Wallbacteria bacterium]
MKLTRREFIKLGLGAAVTMAANPFSNLLFAEENKTKEPDIVGVQNGTAAEMFERGIKEFGGMSRFVKKDQIVVVKPNIGWAKTPQDGANTQPELVAKIIEHAYGAGAKKVYVFDNTCDGWRECYKNSGIEKAAQDGKASVMPANKVESYKKRDAKGGKLKDVLVHELYLEADVVINVPVLKHHGSATMTSALKNLMGVVWDRRYYHRNGLHECIADFTAVRKPDLNIIDAYQVMTKNGPRGMSKSDVAMRRMQIIGTDMVALDTAAAKILEFDPAQIKYLPMAEKLGAGSMNLEKLSIKRITI